MNTTDFYIGPYLLARVRIVNKRTPQRLACLSGPCARCGLTTSSGAWRFLHRCITTAALNPSGFHVCISRRLRKSRLRLASMPRWASSGVLCGARNTSMMINEGTMKCHP